MPGYGWKEPFLWLFKCGVSSRQNMGFHMAIILVTHSQITAEVVAGSPLSWFGCQESPNDPWFLSGQTHLTRRLSYQKNYVSVQFICCYTLKMTLHFPIPLFGSIFVFFNYPSKIQLQANIEGKFLTDPSHLKERNASRHRPQSIPKRGPACHPSWCPVIQKIGQWSLYSDYIYHEKTILKFWSSPSFSFLPRNYCKSLNELGPFLP